MKLAAFVMDLMGQAAKMRAEGVSQEDIQKGLHASLLDFAHANGLVVKDADLPPWLLKKCPVCHDSGWEPTTRLVRGELVEAYKRCSCRPLGISQTPHDQHIAAEKVAGGWSKVGRK